MVLNGGWGLGVNVLYAWIMSDVLLLDMRCTLVNEVIACNPIQSNKFIAIKCTAAHKR